MSATAPAQWWGRPLAETRWTLELGRLLIDPVFAGVGVQRGDGRPILLMPALIGHSRGGHFARALAARRPELISHAVSLGADLQQMLDVNAPTRWAITRAGRVLVRTGRARSPRCLTRACDCSFTADFARPFPQEHVRLTSIYSRGDGVVRWQTQIVPYADCVEITGSHVGLIFNRKAYVAIASALAQTELPQPEGVT
jgi:pimeloyl-ACP methyl ester carboxylesterase